MMGANMQIGRTEINLHLLLHYSKVLCGASVLCWKLLVYVSRVHF